MTNVRQENVTINKKKNEIKRNTGVFKIIDLLISHRKEFLLYI